MSDSGIHIGGYDYSQPYQGEFVWVPMENVCEAKTQRVFFIPYPPAYFERLHQEEQAKRNEKDMLENLLREKLLKLREMQG